MLRHAWVCVIALVLSAPSALLCSFQPPSDGEIVRTFAPVGRYGGHWGVDYASTVGGEVTAIGNGVVVFAGSVAGMSTVSVDHGSGLRSSLSYLESVLVGRGEIVSRGQVIGTSGVDHGLDAVHLSIRIHGVYVDPLAFQPCELDVPSGLRLLPPSDI